MKGNLLYEILMYSTLMYSTVVYTTTTTKKNSLRETPEQVIFS